MKAAMKSGDKERLGTIRLILSAIKQAEIDGRSILDDHQTIAILEKMAKQRRESIVQFQSAGRQDLVDKEQAELAVIQAYLPELLSESEIDRLILAVIQETGASDLRDMGRVMAQLKPILLGRADMGHVSARVKNLLNQG